jgi:hypothetical protein
MRLGSHLSKPQPMLRLFLYLNELKLNLNSTTKKPKVLADPLVTTLGKALVCFVFQPKCLHLYCASGEIVLLSPL